MLAHALHIACYLTLAALYLTGHHDALLIGTCYLALAALVARAHE